MIKKLISTTLAVTLFFTCSFAQVKEGTKAKSTNKKETTMER